MTAALWLRGGSAAGLTFARWSVAAAAVWGGRTLFTTFGTNFPRGLVSGYVGSLGYWLAQQPVERGGQPWFYYPHRRALRAAAAPPRGGGRGAILRRRWRRRAGGEGDLSELLLDFLLWWFVASALLDSAAGERMPWLLVHIALPASLVGGWTVARWAERCAGRRWRRALGAALLALALLATAGQAGRLAFLDYDLPTELLVYAHGTPELRTVERELTARASRLPPGERLLVAHDGVASWPLLWYLRDHDARYLPDGLEPELAAAADVVVLGPEGSRAAWPLLARGFDARPFRSVWWPLEGYRTAGLSEVKSLWTDPAARRAALSYLLRRRVPGVELADWPLRQDLRLHLRRPGSSETPVPLHSPPPVAILTPVFAGDPGSAAEAVAAGCGGRLVASEPGGGGNRDLAAAGGRRRSPPRRWRCLPGGRAARGGGRRRAAPLRRGRRARDPRRRARPRGARSGRRRRLVGGGRDGVAALPVRCSREPAGLPAASLPSGGTRDRCGRRALAGRPDPPAARAVRSRRSGRADRPGGGLGGGGRPSGPRGGCGASLRLRSGRPAAAHPLGGRRAARGLDPRDAAGATLPGPWGRGRSDRDRLWWPIPACGGSTASRLPPSSPRPPSRAGPDRRGRRRR